MKITAIKVIVCSPGCNFIRQDFTDQGLTGVGDATLNGREKAVVAYLQDHEVNTPPESTGSPWTVSGKDR
jgi:mannonate dehydratase